MDQLDWHMARAALQWQAELGVSDAVGDVPIDRYEVPAQSPKLPTAAANAAQRARGCRRAGGSDDGDGSGCSG